MSSGKERRLITRYVTVGIRDGMSIRDAIIALFLTAETTTLEARIHTNDYAGSECLVASCDSPEDEHEVRLRQALERENSLRKELSELFAPGAAERQFGTPKMYGFYSETDAGHGKTAFFVNPSGEEVEVCAVTTDVNGAAYEALDKVFIGEVCRFSRPGGLAREVQMSKEKLTTVSFLYKCRLCGNTYESGSTGNRRGLMCLIESSLGNPVDPGLFPSMFDVHACQYSDMIGAQGISDLVGHSVPR